MSTTVETPAARYRVGDVVGVYWPTAVSPLVAARIGAANFVFGAWEYQVAVPDGGTAFYQEGEIADPPAPAPPAPASPAHTPGQAVLVQMPVGWIEADPDNERGADLGDLTELAASIRERGILQPLRVYKVGDKRFRLSAGHRRLAAAGQIGLERVPVLIVPPPGTDADRHQDRLIDNLQQEGLTPLQEAHGYAALRALGLTQGQIAAQVGKDQSRISRMLALLKQPEPIQAALATGALTPGHVEQLQRITEPALSWASPTETPADEVRTDLAQRAAAGGWSVRHLESTVEAHLNAQRAIHDQRRSEARDQQALRTVATRTSDPGRAAKAAEEDRQRGEAELRRKARLDVARQAIRTVLGDAPEDEAGISLTALGVVTAYLVNAIQHQLSDELRTQIQAAIEQSTDADALLTCLQHLAPTLISLDYEGTRLSQYNTFLKWVEARWQLNARITAALEAAGLADAMPTSPAAPQADEQDDEDAGDEDENDYIDYDEEDDDDDTDA